MAQHISIRVPCHNHGWNGKVCTEPSCNNACLRLKNIYENRSDALEDELCGQYVSGLEDKVPCIGESEIAKGNHIRSTSLSFYGLNITEEWCQKNNYTYSLVSDEGIYANQVYLENLEMIITSVELL